MKKYGRSRFVNFSPLPNTSTDKSKFVPYTKRAKRQPSLDFYKGILQSGFKPRELPKNRNVRLHDPPFYTQCKRQARIGPGDLVEIISRDGEIDFGAVTLVSDDGNYINLISANGTRSKKHVSNVSFAVRNFFIKEEYVHRNMVPRYLSSIVSRALTLVPVLSPSVRIAYAHLVKDRPDTGFTAVHLEDIFSLVKHLNPKTRSLLSNRSAENLLALYLAVNCSSPFFMRLNSNSSIYHAINEETGNAINKIMKTLTDVEFDRFVSALKNGNGELPMLLERFLHYYVLSQDDKLAPAVDALLSGVYPERDSHEWLTSSDTVQPLLENRATSISTMEHKAKHPFLSKYGFADFDGNFSGLLKDGLEKSIDAELEKPFTEKTHLNDPKNRLEWKSPVFVFNDEPELYGASNGGDPHKTYTTIGLSLDPVTRRLHLHIPDVGSILRPRDHRGLMGLLAYRAHSWGSSVPSDVADRTLHGRVNLPLFPPWFSKELDLGDRNNQLVNCLTVSVNIDGKYEADDSVELVATSIPTALLIKSANHTIDSDYVKQLGASLETNGDSTSFFSNVIYPASAIQFIEQVLVSFHKARNTDKESSLSKEAHHLYEYLIARLCRRENIAVRYRTQNSIYHNSQSFAHELIAKRYYTNEISNQPQYVTSANPLHYMDSIMAQWRLIPYIWRNLQFPEDRILDQYKNDQYYAKNMSTFKIKRKAIDQIQQKLKKYAILRDFDLSLKSDAMGYFIFPVTITQGASYPDLAMGVCDEIGPTEIDIQLSNSTQVNVGDKIMCTELVELKPVDGLCVLSM